MKKFYNILLATNNHHKILEFQDYFQQHSQQVVVEIFSLQNKVSPEETGTSYRENAFIKAESFYQAYKKELGKKAREDILVLADDSGLEVKAFPNLLGVQSARYGGENLNDRDRALRLLEEFQKFSQENPEGVVDRSAFFTAQLCLYLNPREAYFFEGRVQGKILHQYHDDEALAAQGKIPFGYDPIFSPEGFDTPISTMPEYKQQNSHRSRALEYLLNFLTHFQRQDL